MIRTTLALEDSAVTSLLGRLTSQFSQAGISSILGEVGRQIGRVVVLRYPPQLPPVDPRRRYRRTGKLARSLEFVVRVQGYEAVVLATIPDDSLAGKYAKYVVGSNLDRSEYFKRSHWQPLTFMIEDQTAEVVAALVVAFETVFKDLGL